MDEMGLPRFQVADLEKVFELPFLAMFFFFVGQCIVSYRVGIDEEGVGLSVNTANGFYDAV